MSGPSIGGATWEEDEKRRAAMGLVATRNEENWLSEAYCHEILPPHPV
jgi:hypothetical protein